MATCDQHGGYPSSHCPGCQAAAESEAETLRDLLGRALSLLIGHVRNEEWHEQAGELLARVEAAAPELRRKRPLGFESGHTPEVHADPRA